MCGWAWAVWKDGALLALLAERFPAVVRIVSSTGYLVKNVTLNSLESSSEVRENLGAWDSLEYKLHVERIHGLRH